jgi:hypothetical protein
MKKVYLITFLLFAGGWLCAQATSSPWLPMNEKRLDKQKSAMLILGGWAAGNIVFGGAMGLRGEGEARYFHLMNAGWNLVNLSLASVGYLGALRADPSALGAYETVRAQYNLQKLLLFNAGLDIGYMAGGLYLLERGKRVEKNAEMLRGFGRAIILQGGFLFAFDTIAYLAFAADNKLLTPLLESLHFNGQTLGFVLRF